MANKKVYIIGNNKHGGNIYDGGRIKIRIYYNLLLKCGVDVEIIDIYKLAFNFFKVVSKIKKVTKSECSILVMGGPRGCRLFIPLVNHYNKKHLCRVVFCPLGIGTIDAKVKKLNSEQLTNLLNCKDDYGIKDEKMAKELKKIDLIIPQNEILVNAYKWFYKISNVKLLNNFRDVEILPKKYSNKEVMNIVFAARVWANKGIFDLLKAVTELNKDKVMFKLDIFGVMELDDNEQKIFNSYLGEDISYKGPCKQSETIDKIREHDLFVLPTKYYGEGTPGSLIESFIAGTPALISSYSQAHLLVDDNKTGYIFEINNVESLKEKLLYIYNHQDELKSIGLNAQENSKKYVFENNKELFLKYIIGE